MCKYYVLAGLCALCFVAATAIAFSPLWNKSREYEGCEKIYQDLEKNQSLLELGNAVGG